MKVPFALPKLLLPGSIRIAQDVYIRFRAALLRSHRDVEDIIIIIISP